MPAVTSRKQAAIDKKIANLSVGGGGLGIISKGEAKPSIAHPAALLLLPLAGAAAALAMVPLPPNADLTNWFVPWMEAVRAGGLSSLSAEFSNYSPPYIYLMYLVAGLVPLVGPVAAIKLICAPFVAAMAAGVGMIVGQATGDRSRALTAAAMLCVTPTILVNAFAWGQSDSIYACFLVYCVLFAASSRPAMAAAMFGLALSFKLQAMFLSPLLLYLILSRQMRPAHLLLVPLVWLAMMVPAALAGRPWVELLTVYYQQGRYFGDLSVNAPNPWYFVTAFDLISYKAGAVAGLLIGAAAGLAIAIVSLRLRPGSATTLLVATLCAAALPYLLPKMHERFFFVADVLTVALAFALPRYWPAALLFQLGSLTAYLVLYDIAPNAPAFAFVPISLGLLVLLAAFRDRLKAGRGASP